MFLRIPAQILTLALALFSACTRSGDPQDPLSLSLNGSSTVSQAPTATLSCKSPQDCSPSVALLVIREGSETRECMGSLVGDDLLLTASHCLPDELRHSGAWCEGTIEAQFAANRDYPELRSECQEILAVSSAVSDHSLAQQDYAIIRLSKATKRPSFAIDHSGFENGDSYTMISAMNGLIASNPCRAIRGSEILPGSDQAESPVIAIADCGASSSSDGAPILDSTGKLRGIFQSLVPAARIAKKASTRPSSEPTLASIAYATNFSCVRLPNEEDDYAFPPACQINPNVTNSQTESNKFKSLLAQGIARTDSQFQWPQLSSDFQWETKAFLGSSDEGKKIAQALKIPSDAISLFTIPFPKCVKSNSALATMNFNLPIVGYEYTLNRYLVLGLNSGRSLGSVPARLEITPPILFWSGINTSLGKHVNLFIDTETAIPPRILRKPISTCVSSSAE